MAQATATKIYEHEGKKYRLADHRDIGKEVYIDDADIEQAISDPCLLELTDISVTPDFPFKTAACGWRHAFVELEAPVPAVVPFNGTLEVGQWYETNEEKRLHCNSRTHHDTYPMVMVEEDGCVETYMEKGLWIEDHDMDAEDSIALHLVGCTGFDWPKPVSPAPAPEPRSLATAVIDNLCKTIHEKNVAAGWWDAAGNPLVVPTKLALVVSEVAEALEGHRRGLKDDKLPEYDMIGVELADVLIRVFDLAGFLGIELGTIMEAKERFNSSRSDHKPEVRKGQNGKRY